MVNNIENQARKVSMCLLGQIETDINLRLPTKPRELSNYEKYLLIKEGKATLKELHPDSFNYQPGLISAYTYPEREEEKTYRIAEESIREEQSDRELAVESTLRRLVGQAVLEIISLQDFLTALDKLSSQKW